MRHKDKVESVALSPNGEWAASGGWDGVARVWDAKTGRPLAEMNYRLPVGVLAFGPDGRWLLAGSRDGDADAWLWNVEDLIDLACKGAQRDLSPEQWREHGVATSPLPA
jgi:WD40 repeat protein